MTTAVAPKAPTKIAQARALFEKIKADGPAEGSSVRKDFIAQAQGEIGISQACATTYYNNLKNEAAGQDLYKYTGKKKKPEAAPVEHMDADEPAEEAADLLDTFAPEDADMPVDDEVEQEEDNVEA